MSWVTGPAAVRPSSLMESCAIPKGVGCLLQYVSSGGWGALILTATQCARCRKRKIKCSGDAGDGQSCTNCRSAGNTDCQFLRVSLPRFEAAGRQSVGDLTWCWTDEFLEPAMLAISVASNGSGTLTPTCQGVCSSFRQGHTSCNGLITAWSGRTSTRSRL